MTKVDKSHSKGTFAGAFGNDEDAPKNELARGRGAGVAVGAISER
jgi:hypothetical protein